MDTSRDIVLALGGNAISREDESGDIPQQFEHTRRTAARLRELVEQGYRLVVTHGNGPQVGSVLRRVEIAADQVYRLPLDICVADTQGGMGYMIALCLNNEFRRAGLPCSAAAVVTTVEVTADDPAFREPSKPVGRVFDPQEAKALAGRYGWTLAPSAAGKMRRVVPSPTPRRILEIEQIRTLVRAGVVVIAGGGGGVPVTVDADGVATGVEAVVDKDRTSALLAIELDAPTFVIATGTRRVALGFRTPAERFLDRLSVSDARRWLEAGEFPAGSMGPKIESAIRFLEQSRAADARVIICHLDTLSESIAGRDGTLLVRS